MIRTLFAVVLIALQTFAGGALAAPLVGSGQHLALPASNLGDSTRAAPGTLFPTYVVAVPQNKTTPPSHTGTWSAPAHPDWVGTWSAVGLRTSNTREGTTFFDFSALPTGALPAGTFFRFGDMDTGSSVSETFTMQAYTDAASTQLANQWLDMPSGYRTVTGTGAGGAVLPVDMPGWSYTAATSTYYIDGNTVTAGNPNVAFVLQTNQPIVTLTVIKEESPYQLDFLAPVVPEPGALMLVAGAITYAMLRRTS